MKNLKMILTAAGVFAVVGTALALNARRNVEFCVSPTGQSSLTCAATPVSRLQVQTGGTLTFAVQKVEDEDCNDNTIHKCQTQIRLANEQ
jgi:hypothetical protein